MIMAFFFYLSGDKEQRFLNEDEDISNNQSAFNDLDTYEYNRKYIEKYMGASIDIFVGWRQGGSFDKDFLMKRYKELEIQ